MLIVPMRVCVKDANKIASLHRLSLLFLQKQGCQSVNVSNTAQHSQQSFRIFQRHISTSICNREKEENPVIFRNINTTKKNRYEDQEPLNLKSTPHGVLNEPKQTEMKRWLTKYGFKVVLAGTLIYFIVFAKKEVNYELNRVMSTPVYDLDPDTDGQVIRNEMALRAMRGKSNQDLEVRLKLIVDEKKRMLAEEKKQEQKNYKNLGPRKTIKLTKEDTEEEEERKMAQ